MGKDVGLEKLVCKLLTINGLYERIHPICNEFDESIANAPPSIESCLSHVTSNMEYPGPPS